MSPRTASVDFGPLDDRGSAAFAGAQRRGFPIESARDGGNGGLGNGIVHEGHDPVVKHVGLGLSGFDRLEGLFPLGGEVGTFEGGGDRLDETASGLGGDEGFSLAGEEDFVDVDRIAGGEWREGLGGGVVLV